MNEGNSRSTIDGSLVSLSKAIAEAHSVVDVLEERLANVLSPQTTGQRPVEKFTEQPARFVPIIDSLRGQVSSLTGHLHEIINSLDLEVRPSTTTTSTLR